ncbi:Rv3235 family protein [Corynebacterium tapiri]|uniref:Uncharacterized protein n=1 Tax=Corynebacterium tapiri TaxID=1448266 RepID=A0A5C4U3X3_9CORY|nr:Rv3235 family protein [Corynebacterium tapiri]TNL98413.1 hypothetical protein FHE74_04230 [Corynebacterium tapiri]
MLAPIPGTVHLKMIVPDPPEPKVVETPPALASESERLARALIQVALEVCCSVRPVEHLSLRRFATAVRRHAHMRRRTLSVSGPVALHSLHICPSAGDEVEITGSARCSAETLAYTARFTLEGIPRLSAFRVL